MSRRRKRNRDRRILQEQAKKPQKRSPAHAQTARPLTTISCGHNVFIGTPMYSPTCLSDGVLSSVLTGCLPGGPVGRAPVPFQHQSSLLTQAFNQLWADAVDNELYDVFAMLHTDVLACPGWIDISVSAMDERDADLIAAGVRIKDAGGDFSCGIDKIRGDKWSTHRLNGFEIDQLPQVYSRDDVVRLLNLNPDECGAMVLNTGCWIANLTKARRTWARKVVFRFHDEIHWKDDHPELKRSKAVCASEDWELHRQLFDLGVKKVFGTSRVRTQHLGFTAFDSEWRPTPQPGEEGVDATVA